MKPVPIAVAVLLSLLLCSCSRREFVYGYGLPALDVHETGEGLLYEGGNRDSDAAVVYLDGGFPRSVLGSEEEVFLAVGPSMYWWFLREFGDDWAVASPEREGAEPGGAYRYSEGFLLDYTVQNLIPHYAALIDSYLSSRSIDRAVLVGQSEGALLLPGVYLAMAESARVEAMVSFYGGGMSPYEYSQVGSDMGPAAVWRALWNQLEEHSDSIEYVYNGLTYRYWYSWKQYSPLECYRQIDIPVLFIHGTADTRVPPESTRVVESSLPQKPFEYWYVDGMGHGDETADEFTEELANVRAWIEGL